MYRNGKLNRIGILAIHTRWHLIRFCKAKKPILPLIEGFLLELLSASTQLCECGPITGSVPIGTIQKVYGRSHIYVRFKNVQQIHIGETMYEMRMPMLAVGWLLLLIGE